MNHEYLPTPQNNRTKRLATWLFICGAILFVVSGIKAIPFRFIPQIIALCFLTASIMIMGRFLLRAYAYRIDDMGEGNEVFVDEITRNMRYTVCRLELKKLVKMTKWEEYSKEERGKKRYNYAPDVFGDGTYVLEFIDGAYDVTAERIRIRILPDEKLIEIFEQAIAQNLQNTEE